MSRHPLVRSTEVHVTIKYTVTRDASDYVDYVRSRLDRYVSYHLDK